MNEQVYITTPVGRFIMGDAFKGNDKDMQGRPKFDKTGKPKTTWFMGIAIPKTDPGWAELWGQITAVGQRDFPAGQWQQPTFAWKVADGDGVNQDGKPYPDYCKGCYVLKMSSGFAPTIYNAQNQQIVDPSQIKRGDYVRAYIGVNGNADLQKPGVYINHQMVQVVGFGEAITSGPDAVTVFGAPAQLPPGASTVPVATGAMPAPSGVPTTTAQTTAVNPVPVGPTNVAPVPVAPAGVPAPAPAGVPAQPTVSPGEVQPYPQILQGPTQ